MEKQCWSVIRDRKTQTNFDNITCCILTLKSLLIWSKLHFEIKKMWVYFGHDDKNWETYICRRHANMPIIVMECHPSPKNLICWLNSKCKCTDDILSCPKTRVALFLFQNGLNWIETNKVTLANWSGIWLRVTSELKFQFQLVLKQFGKNK
jgi:hypothetical protein